jgi:ribose-phosphate pyrophosphokinase
MADTAPEAEDPSLQDMKLFTGRANPALAKEVARLLKVNLGRVAIKGFADGEIGIQVQESVCGKNVFVLQPTCPPGVNDHLVELLMLASTMRRAQARDITAVIPYYGYARQDRIMVEHSPISAADVACLIEAVGVNRVVAVDLHCGQIQGFFRIPSDNLEGYTIGRDYFSSLLKKNSVPYTADTLKVISPDAGGVFRARQFRAGLAEHGIEAGLSMIIKQRVKANAVESMDLVGSVAGADVIIVDDMIDTAGTLCHAATELKKRGAGRVYAFATHGVFSGPAYERIAGSDLEQVVVCDTIPLDGGKDHDGKIVHTSIAPMVAAAIRRIHTQLSHAARFAQRNNNNIDK